MKRVYIALAVEILAIAVLIHRARTPYKLTGPTVSGTLPLDRFKPRRSTGGPTPGVVGAVEYRRDGGPTLY